MSNPTITKETLQFLECLKINNNRTWFEEHKTAFKRHEAAAKTFFTAVKEELNTHDAIEKLKMFRIYRDVRFSHDKTLYQPHFAGSFSRAGAKLRGGYYLRIRPGGESFIGCGFWQPDNNDLHRIRKELELDSSNFKKIIDNSSFKNAWGELKGEELKTAPKGFDKEDPNIALIRKKAFLFTHEFTDEEVIDPDFFSDIGKRFRAIRPFFDLMSDILTTNLNGESLLD